MSLIDRMLRLNREEGAVVALIVGIILGVVLVVFGIIKFLIPGD